MAHGPELRFHNIVIRHPHPRDTDAKTTAAMILTMASGRVREVPLDERALIGLIAEAAHALSILAKAPVRS